MYPGVGIVIIEQGGENSRPKPREEETTA